jgi:hypothetical protein
MRIQNFKQLRTVLIASLIFAGIPALPAPTEAERTSGKAGAAWQDTVTITCPASVVIGVKDTPQGWFD